MNITVTIADANASERLQTIGVALGTTGSDVEQKGHLANHLKTITRNLYERGDKIERQTSADQTAKDIADADIDAS